jgi:hypothetical protein
MNADNPDVALPCRSRIAHRKMHLLRNHNGVVCLTGNGIVRSKSFVPHDDLARSASDPRRASLLLCTLREMRTRHFNCLIRGLRSPAQRSREADGWPAKVRKLGYWKGFSACKSFHAMEPVQQAGETPRTCWQPGRSLRWRWRWPWPSGTAVD